MPAAYQAARAAVIAQSGLWTGLVAATALLAGVAAAGFLARMRRADERKRTGRPSAGKPTLGAWPSGAFVSRAALALTVALWAGWARLALMHIEIWRAIRIPDMGAELPASGLGPAGASGAAGVAVPVWIEGEKLYAWACLLAVSVLLLWRRREDPIFAWGVLAVVGLSIAALAATNPFTVPLPGLHAELAAYFQDVGSPNAQVAADAMRQMWARKTFFYNTAYMWTHPPALFVSYAAFTVSFIASIMLLATRAVRYDRIAYAWAKPGYVVLTAGMLIGYPWAVLAWREEPWWWSGKINMSLMLWVLYSAYLHSRLYIRRKGMWRLVGWLGVASFAALVLTYLSTYLVPGAHSVAQP